MNGKLAHIFRHPIKGHGRESLEIVTLKTGECLPWDRHWAVAHEAAKLEPGWNRCVNFARGAKAPALMAITAKMHEETGAVILSHPDRGTLVFDPDDPDDLPLFLDWVEPLNPPDRAKPAKIVTAGRGMTDSDYPSVTILSLASLADLSARMGMDLSVHRWRGNLWIDGAAPWAELDWVGRHIRIGDALLKIAERTERCKATTANPETGVIDADTLGALEEAFGHRDFGVHATVVEGGLIGIGCPWSMA